MKIGDEDDSIELGGKELDNVNFRFTGDTVAAQRYIGEARKVLGELKQGIQLGELQSGLRKIQIAPGVTVFASSYNGTVKTDIVNINVAPKPQPKRVTRFQELPEFPHEFEAPVVEFEAHDDYEVKRKGWEEEEPEKKEEKIPEHYLFGYIVTYYSDNPDFYYYYFDFDLKTPSEKILQNHDIYEGDMTWDGYPDHNAKYIVAATDEEIQTVYANDMNHVREYIFTGPYLYSWDTVGQPTPNDGWSWTSSVEYAEGVCATIDGNDIRWESSTMEAGSYPLTSVVVTENGANTEYASAGNMDYPGVWYTGDWYYNLGQCWKSGASVAFDNTDEKVAYQGSVVAEIKGTIANGLSEAAYDAGKALLPIEEDRVYEWFDENVGIIYKRTDDHGGVIVETGLLLDQGKFELTEWNEGNGEESLIMLPFKGEDEQFRWSDEVKNKYLANGSSITDENYYLVARAFVEGTPTAIYNDNGGGYADLNIRYEFNVQDYFGIDNYVEWGEHTVTAYIKSEDTGRYNIKLYTNDGIYELPIDKVIDKTEIKIKVGQFYIDEELSIQSQLLNNIVFVKQPE
jgi:hypothetical protein